MYGCVKFTLLAMCLVVSQGAWASDDVQVYCGLEFFRDSVRLFENGEIESGRLRQASPVVVAGKKVYVSGAEDLRFYPGCKPREGNLVKNSPVPIGEFVLNYTREGKFRVDEDQLFHSSGFLREYSKVFQKLPGGTTIEIGSFEGYKSLPPQPIVTRGNLAVAFYLSAYAHLKTADQRILYFANAPTEINDKGEVITGKFFQAGTTQHRIFDNCLWTQLPVNHDNPDGSVTLGVQSLRLHADGRIKRGLLPPHASGHPLCFPSEMAQPSRPTVRFAHTGARLYDEVYFHPNGVPAKVESAAMWTAAPRWRVAGNRQISGRPLGAVEFHDNGQVKALLLGERAQLWVAPEDQTWIEAGVAVNFDRNGYLHFPENG